MTGLTKSGLATRWGSMQPHQGTMYCYVMNAENITPTKIRRTQKDKYHESTYMRNLEWANS